MVKIKLINVFQSITVYITLKTGTCKVKEVVTDYERAIWRGMEDVFPKVKVLGCAFHWTQAIFRNMKK